MLENTPICMLRPNLAEIPQHPLPAPLSLRPYQPGDEAVWIAIHLAADEYNLVTPQLFTEQFGTDPEVLARRQFYLCAAGGQAIGTATAWFNSAGWGRVHWVAIHPAWQGRGLAKPLLTAVCNRLAELGHPRAYLTTESARLPAINLYLHYGFTPDIRDEREAQVWAAIQAKLAAK